MTPRARPTWVDPCPDCGLELSPAPGVVWYRPLVDSEPGPAVIAVTILGMAPALYRYERREFSVWELRRPSPAGGDEQRRSYGRVGGQVLMRWPQIGRCEADRLHPVVAVHRDGDGHWQHGVGPGAVGEQSKLLMAAWFVSIRQGRA